MSFLSSVTGAVEDVATGGLASFVPGTAANSMLGPASTAYTALGAAGAIGGGVLLGYGPQMLTAAKDLAPSALAFYGAEQTAKSVQEANAMNASIAQGQQNFSAQQVLQQEAFQENMSDTSVQRMQADMKAAGINPMLAAGSGESTPSGSVAPAAGYTAQPVPSVIANTTSSAASLISTLANVHASLSAANNSDAQADSARASAGLTKAKTPVALTEAKIATWINLLLDKIGSTASQMYNNAIAPDKVRLPSGSDAALNAQ